MVRVIPVTDTNELKLKFDGESHQIEAKTLINSLTHFTSVVEQANSEIKSSKKIEIKINANQPGSFIVDLFIGTSPVLGQAGAIIFNQETLSYTNNLIKLVVSLYNMHKFLDGKKPKGTETVDGSLKVENIHGDVTIIDKRTFNIYQNNNNVRASISSGFQTLDRDAKVQGLEFLDHKDASLLKINRTEFPALSNEAVYVLSKEKEVTITGFQYRDIVLRATKKVGLYI